MPQLPKTSEPVDCFCLDTSFFINGWHKHYPLDVFPSLWESLDKCIKSGRVFSCDEVFKELEKRDDSLFAWVKSRRTIFSGPSANTIASMKRVMAQFPNFAALGGSANRADPWLVAHAMNLGASIVTDEVPAANQKSTKPPKIPDVCDHFGISWMKPVEFLKNVRMQF